MPICERDPWRYQFFERVECPADVNIPTDDIDSFEWYPDFRWVYEKINIARSQGLACGLVPDAPTQFPVFAKPNINLRGMGLGSRVVRSAEEFATLPAGHMWMNLLEGDHISVDCAVVNGKVHWMRQAQGFPWDEGMFTHWMIDSEQDPDLKTFLHHWVKQHMHGYTGMMNFEAIGGTVIEAHLRFADQWCDLYGSGWMDALVTLYHNGIWQMPSDNGRTGYSIPLFARHGLVPPHPTKEQQAAIRAMPEVSSLQITYFAAKPGEAHPMPPGGFRLGLINSWTLPAGLAARDQLAACFPGVQLLLPPTVT